MLPGKALLSWGHGAGSLARVLRHHAQLKDLLIGRGSFLTFARPCFGDGTSSQLTSNGAAFAARGAPSNNAIARRNTCNVGRRNCRSNMHADYSAVPKTVCPRLHR